MRIVYLGSGQFGLDCLNAISGSTHDLKFIITSKASPAGRGRKLRRTAVAQWACENNIPVAQIENVNCPEVIEEIRKYRPDLIVVIAFGQKVGREIIEIAQHRAINVHASILPKYRGAAPINWAIANGEKYTGISIITLAQKMDAGDILAISKAEIKEDETAGLLHDRLAKLAAPLLLRTLEEIEKGTAVYTEQDHSMATVAPKLKKTDAFVDFNCSAEVVKNRIAAFNPWPAIAVEYISERNGKRQKVILLSASIIKNAVSSDIPVGSFDEDLNVICGEGSIRITRIKPAGGTAMDFENFVNGRMVQPGDRLVKINA